MADIAVFEVDMQKLTEAEIRRAPRLELADALVDSPALSARTTLMMEGYPYELARLSPELFVTVRPSCKLLAIHQGETDREAISQLEIPEFAGLTDLNGMSGSPVFAIRFSDQSLKWRFEGMLIQGSVASGRGYYIRAGIIIRALQRCVQNR